MEQNFKSGDVVMLKSGETKMVVANTINVKLEVVYFNAVTGKIEKNEIDRNCFTLCQE